MSEPKRTDSVERTLFELNRDARTALGQGAFTVALEKLRVALKLEPGSPNLWINYAAALRQSKDVTGALDAVTEALKREPRSFNALLLKGLLLEEAGENVEAGRVYGIALLFRPAGMLDPPTANAVRHAEAMNNCYRNDLATAVDLSIETLGPDTVLSQNIRRFVAHVTGRARIFTPEPSEFHIPGLASQEFFDRDLFPWIGGLEQSTDLIAEELQAALRNRPDLLVPYIDQDESLPLDQWADLNKSDRWSALHVIRHGTAATSSAGLFPNTLKALQQLPQPDVPGRTPNAMFSALQPRTTIPPHTGVSNARLVLHLPLIVPAGCGFRVGSQTREWKRGEAWVFDDTIEHEAWNNGDDIRVVLIADIWNVFMTDAERLGYRAVLAGLDWHNAPTAPQSR